jgi:hypothetical protein
MCKCDWHRKCGGFDTPIEAGLWCVEELQDHGCVDHPDTVWTEVAENHYEGHEADDEGAYEAAVWKDDLHYNETSLLRFAAVVLPGAEGRHVLGSQIPFGVAVEDVDDVVDGHAEGLHRALVGDLERPETTADLDDNAGCGLRLAHPLSDNG